MKKITKNKEGEVLSVEEFDEKGNSVYFKTSAGFEWWKEYDENNRCVHYKDSDGVEEFYEYYERLE